MRYVTCSPEQTRSLGEKLASFLLPGDVLVLRGEMGAGKSEFARGIARGLHIGGPIASPTFTILNVYDQGRLPLYHFDWYRIQDEEELLEIGAPEYLLGDGAALVEWAERAPHLLPASRLEVSITPGEGEDTRIIEFTPMGGFRWPFPGKDSDA